MPDFCRIFAGFSQLGPGEMYRVPGGYPGGSPQFAFSRKLPHTAPPKKLAPAAPLGLAARPLSATSTPRTCAGRRASGRSPSRGRRPRRSWVEAVQLETREGNVTPTYNFGLNSSYYIVCVHHFNPFCPIVTSYHYSIDVDHILPFQMDDKKRAVE